jgi:hypothetical protein
VKEVNMSYPKYAWIGNRITQEDMASLYCLKQQTKKPITVLVAEAISQYLSIKRKEKEEKI